MFPTDVPTGVELLSRLRGSRWNMSPLPPVHSTAPWPSCAVQLSLLQAPGPGPIWLPARAVRRPRRSALAPACPISKEPEAWAPQVRSPPQQAFEGYHSRACRSRSRLQACQGGQEGSRALPPARSPFKMPRVASQKKRCGSFRLDSDWASRRAFDWRSTSLSTGAFRLAFN